jgi:predicted amidophosphoribosyltransferase
VFGTLDQMLADLVDLVLPRHCYGCGRAGAGLCGTCAPIALVAVDCAGLPVIAAGRYEGPLRDAVLAYKERGRRDLARPLAALLGAAVAALDVPNALLVPIPSAASARRARGGDHVLRLSRRVGPSTPAVRLTRAVQDSAGLGANARAANLAGAFSARPPRCRGAYAVVVDDIVTTGATLAEATRALTHAGWHTAGGAVVAATPLRSTAKPPRVARRRGPV